MSGADPDSEPRLEPLGAAMFAELIQLQSAARDIEEVASQHEMLWMPEAETAEQGLDDLMNSMSGLNLSGRINDEQLQQDKEKPSTPPHAQPTSAPESKNSDSGVQDVAQRSVEQMAHQMSRLTVSEAANDSDLRTTATPTTSGS